MSATDTGVASGQLGADLLAIVDRVVAQAKPGEQVEAFVSRGGDTEVRVYQGEVEHFVSAQAEGIGIRVIRDGRTGFAYAGTLDEAAIAEVLAEARDNVQFGDARLPGLLAEHGRALAPQGLAERLRDEAHAWAPRLHDDLVVLAVRVRA